MTRTHKDSLTRSGYILSGILALFVFFFVFSPDILTDSFHTRAVNSFAATLVLFQGLFVIRGIWTKEMDVSGGSIPLLASFLAIEHMAFGFGGFLVSVFDQDFTYRNEQGLFAFSDSTLPLLIVHAVSLNAAVLAGQIALRTTRSRGPRNALSSRQWGAWLWREHRAICYISLGLHGAVWILLLHVGLPDFALYVVRALSPSLHATFVVWGLVWKECDRKWVFASYAVVFVAFQLMIGARGDGFFPLILFGIGFLVSRGEAGWNFRTTLKWAPLIVFFFWGSVKSEDVRAEFTRGTLGDPAEAAARLASFAANPDEVQSYDVMGAKLNVPFRVGSRLFETSAEDVVARTPGAVPFWGWSKEDVTLLLTGLLPIKLNPNAAYYTDADAGTLYLRNYGWVYVDAREGSSMPATLVGDAWRRSGWSAVILIFFCGGWIIAKGALFLRFRPGNTAILLYSSAVLASYINQYDSDLISLISYAPRRLMIAGVYTVGIWGLAKVFGHPGNRPISIHVGRSDRDQTGFHIPAGGSSVVISGR